MAGRSGEPYRGAGSGHRARGKRQDHGPDLIVRLLAWIDWLKPDTKSTRQLALAPTREVESPTSDRPPVTVRLSANDHFSSALGDVVILLIHET